MLIAGENTRLLHNPTQSLVLEQLVQDSARLQHAHCPEAPEAPEAGWRIARSQRLRVTTREKNSLPSVGVSGWGIIGALTLWEPFIRAGSQPARTAARSAVAPIDPGGDCLSHSVVGIVSMIARPGSASSLLLRTESGVYPKHIIPGAEDPASLEDLSRCLVGEDGSHHMISDLGAASVKSSMPGSTRVQNGRRASIRRSRHAW
ncbi:hypothetical protein BO71DRAFT_432638 [Aspergillus ellipticus CBS 707.79]|uniref:Uncharacterized protein n=1 Tax=Aspergillus ellipticus CBS 707.79 TaxID=1448320 RepID=A0A319D2E6_9EURO|nr:hypothetical protein BO71DRAFT_432638 [Aspergillus ellipticus CBS 707.79]